MKQAKSIPTSVSLFYFFGVFAVSFLMWWAALSLIGLWAFATFVPALVLLWYKTWKAPVQPVQAEETE
jgi:hypothetical protein